MLLQRGAHSLGFALPDARGPDDVGQQERRDPGRECDGCDPFAVRGEEAGPLVEDVPFELGGFRSGRDAELLTEPLPELAEGAECVRLPTAAVLGEHQATPQALVEWMLGDEALRLREDAIEVTELEPEGEQVRSRAEPDLGDSLARREGPLGGAGVEQGLSPPPREGRFEDAGGGRGLRSRERSPVGDFVLEGDRVDLVVGSHDEPISDA